MTRWRFGELGWRFFKEAEVEKTDEQAKKPAVAMPKVPAMPAAETPAPAAAPVSTTAPKTPGIGNIAERLHPSAHKPAANQVVVKDELSCDVACNVAFVGTGQGGGRIADAFYHIGYRRVAVCNTTDMDFAGITDAIPKLNLAVGGSFKDPDFAAQLLRGREEEVWDLMTRAWGNDPDYALICAGLGGGTGSGTAKLLVEIARKYMESKGRPPRVGAVVSLPVTTEGQQVCKNAVHAFRDLLALKVSPLLIIDNARINELFQPSFSALHSTANETISQLFHFFNQLAAVHSPYITFDRSEFVQLLDGGIVVLGFANIPLDKIRSPADISESVRTSLGNSVLAQVDLRRSKKAALLFVGSKEVLQQFSLDYFDAGFEQLNRLVGAAYGKKAVTVVHRGVYEGDTTGLQCYVMISELEPPLERLAGLAKAGMLESASNAKGVAAFLGVQD